MTTKGIEKPQIGDRIKIDDPGSCIDGEEYTVVERPDWASDDPDKWLYVIDYDDPSDTAGSVKIAQCKIISRSGRVLNTVMDDVDASLNKQRDDNLASFFKNHLDYQ